jgi:hypothetical protein
MDFLLGGASDPKGGEFALSEAGGRVRKFERASPRRIDILGRRERTSLFICPPTGTKEATSHAP